MTGQDLICGQGRLGRRVSALLAAAGRPAQPVRLSAAEGLVGLPTTGSENGHDIALLVLCLVPRHPPEQSGWLGLLDGLLGQCQRGELHIGRVALVSSTAVYECHSKGFVDANTPVRPASARSAGLIDAEQKVTQLSADHAIIRLAGICGPGYERYDPVTMSAEQPRHAVDVRAAAALIAELALQPRPAARIELVTDGCIYVQGQPLPARRDEPALAALATSHRLMLPSQIAIWPR